MYAPDSERYSASPYPKTCKKSTRSQTTPLPFTPYVKDFEVDWAEEEGKIIVDKGGERVSRGLLVLGSE